MQSLRVILVRLKGACLQGSASLPAYLSRRSVSSALLRSAASFCARACKVNTQMCSMHFKRRQNTSHEEKHTSNGSGARMLCAAAGECTSVLKAPPWDRAHAQHISVSTRCRGMTRATAPPTHLLQTRCQLLHGRLQPSHCSAVARVRLGRLSVQVQARTGRM